MVDGQRNVGMGRLADRLAVVDGFGQRDQSRLASIRSAILSRMFDRSVEDILPQPPWRHGGIQRGLDIGGAARHLAHHLPGHGRDVVEILTARGRAQVPLM
jgi:hypothetical protein